MEYYEHGGGAVAKLGWVAAPVPPTCAAGEYRAEYFSNPTLSGPPAVAVCEAPPLDHDWGTGVPPGVGPAGTSRSGGPARWRFASPRLVHVHRGRRRRHPGVGRWCRADRRVAGPGADYVHGVVGAGRGVQHEVRVEYYEAGGGAVARSAGPVAAPQPHVRGGAVSGGVLREPDVVRPAGVVVCEARRWITTGASGPAGRGSGQLLGAWTGTLEVPSPRTVYVLRDGGRRDPRVGGRGVLVDQWRDQAPTTFTASRELAAGSSTRCGWSITRRAWARSPAQLGRWRRRSRTCAAGQYRAEYFANQTLSGPPAWWCARRAAGSRLGHRVAGGRGSGQLLGAVDRHVGGSLAGQRTRLPRRRTTGSACGWTGCPASTSGGTRRRLRSRRRGSWPRGPTRCGWSITRRRARWPRSTGPPPLPVPPGGERGPSAARSGASVTPPAVGSSRRRGATSDDGPAHPGAGPVVVAAVGLVGAHPGAADGVHADRACEGSTVIASISSPAGRSKPHTWA